MTSIAKIRILLADDHTILREGLRCILEAEPDMEVVGEARDGAEAVIKARELRPDVVLMDLAMPIMDGLEATRQIAKEDPGAKVLILTMYGTEEYAWLVLEAGATGYVVKKSAAAELASAVRAVARGGVFLSPQLTQRLIAAYTKAARTKGHRVAGSRH